MLRGANLALQQKATVVHLKTGSACVHHVLLKRCLKKMRVLSKAASETLIRRRLDTLRELTVEYGLTIDVGLLRSHDNQAD